MELHQIRYFRAVAETGNFTRAAEQCHVAQASLSQQIIKLEEELGHRLFERLRRRAVLTQAGELLLERAESILGEIQQAKTEIKELDSEPSGKITLGALPTIAPYYLPEIVDQLARAYPKIETHLHEQTTDRLVDSVHRGEVDLAVVSSPIVGQRLVKQDLFHEPLWLALPKKSPLARKKRNCWEDVIGERFILMQEGHCLGQQTLQFCHDRNFQPNVVCRSAQIATVLALIEKGIGISMVPDMAKRSCTTKHIVFRRLEQPDPKRSITVIHRQNRKLPSVLKATLELIQSKGHSSEPA